MMMLAALLLSATPTWPELGPLQRADLGKDDVVLIAGVGRPFVLPPVPGATELATEWYRFFVDGRGVPVENAVLLRDADVTKENLITEAQRLRALKKKAGKRTGTYWLVFIGHGAPASSGQDGLLLGVDVQPTIRSIADRGLPQQALLDAAGGSADDVVAIFDACFTGVRSDGSGAPLVPGAQATLPAKRVAPPRSTTILQASEAVAGPLPGHDRPAFSYLLLGALRGWADDDGDGIVRVKDAFAYVKKTLTIAVRSRNQTPTMVGDGDVIAARDVREEGPLLQDAIAGTQRPRTTETPTKVATATRADPPRPAATSTTTPRRSRDTFDRLAAEEAFRRKRLVASADGFVRGPYATPVDDQSAFVEAGERGRQATLTIAEVTSQQTLALGMGLGVGAIGTAVAGASGFVLLNSSDSPVYGVVGGFLGGLLGVTAGVVTHTILAPSDEDKTRLTAARSDLAEAINTGERQRLGLEP